MIVVSIIANEYPLVSGRLNFILQVASYAKKNDYFIITNEYFKDHFDELINGTTDRFYKEFEMKKLSADELRNIDFCFVPDSLLRLSNWHSSRTDYLLHEFNEGDEGAVSYMVDSIGEALRRRGEKKPEYIMNCIQTTANIRKVAHFYNCPLIPYVFSAIRKPHGYSQTLYMAHFNDNLFNVDNVRGMYEEFNPNGISFTLFNRREILALIGKWRNMHLLPLINLEGRYEVAYAGEGRHIIPQCYQYDHVTDDDIYHDLYKHYNTEQIVTRLHPIQLRQAGFSQEHMKNDPAAFILSAKRLVTVQSQIAVKAALWNRTVCVYGNALPFSFLMKSAVDQTNKITEKDINFILFCYFIPASLMFNIEYWRWRMTNPSANELYVRHIMEILQNQEISIDILQSSNREDSILTSRGLSEVEILETKKVVQADEIDYDFLSACAEIKYSNGSVRSRYILNKKCEQDIQSRFDILCDKTVESIDLYLLDDMDGFIQIKSIVVNDVQYDVDKRMQYVKKKQSCYTISFSEPQNGRIVVEATFMAKPFYKNFEG